MDYGHVSFREVTSPAKRFWVDSVPLELWKASQASRLNQSWPCPGLMWHYLIHLVWWTQPCGSHGTD
ncbi:hypothetical protein BHE74_00034216, partial [Ensete ventricosum]